MAAPQRGQNRASLRTLVPHCPQVLAIARSSGGYDSGMIRIREIGDPELRAKVVAALADRRGMSAAAIPDWFELDDADYVDLLNDIRYGTEEREEHDPRE